MQGMPKLKVLYAIQGTGNGHIARAIELIPVLKEYFQIDIFLSGTQYNLALPERPKFISKGYSFFYSNLGSVDLRKTFLKNSIKKIIRDIYSLPVKNYDLVLSDFECISALAAKLRNVPCVNMSHQAAFKYKETPRITPKSTLGEFLLKNFAPANKYFGFHFRQYHPSIYYPIISNKVRTALPDFSNHYTVYLPAYSVHLIAEKFRKYDYVEWHLFSNGVKSKIQTGNLHLFPLNRNEFIDSMIKSRGIITGGGFETPAEAMYMGKKIISIPIRKQYEQQCNAEALKRLGYPVFDDLNQISAEFINEWIAADFYAPFNFDDQRESLVKALVGSTSYSAYLRNGSESNRDVEEKSLWFFFQN